MLRFCPSAQLGYFDNSLSGVCEIILGADDTETKNKGP